jgi:hypothetical protein
MNSCLSPISPSSDSLNSSLLSDLPDSGRVSSYSHSRPLPQFSSSHARKLRQSFHELSGAEFADENGGDASNRGRPRQSLPLHAELNRGRSMAFGQQTIEIKTPKKGANANGSTPGTNEKRSDRRQTFAPLEPGCPGGSDELVPRTQYAHVCRMLAESHARINELDSNLKLAATIGETLINENSRLEQLSFQLESDVRRLQEQADNSETTQETLKQQIEALKRANLTLIEDQLKRQLSATESDSVHASSSGEYSAPLDEREVQRRLAFERRHWELKLKSAEAKLNAKEEEANELRDQLKSLAREAAASADMAKRVRELEAENGRLMDAASEREFAAASELKQRIAQARRAAELVNDQLRQELNEEREEAKRKEELIQYLTMEIESIKARTNELRKSEQAQEKCTAATEQHQINKEQCDNEVEELQSVASAPAIALAVAVAETEKRAIHSGLIVDVQSAGEAISVAAASSSPLILSSVSTHCSDPVDCSHVQLDTDIACAAETVESTLDASFDCSAFTVAPADSSRLSLSQSASLSQPLGHSNSNAPRFSQSASSGSSSSASVAISLAWSVIDPDFQLSPGDEAKLSEVFELLSHQWRIALLLIESNPNGRENSWVPDEALKDCMNCHKPFNSLRRRHRKIISLSFRMNRISFSPMFCIS